jgi:hypothetical protein
MKQMYRLKWKGGGEVVKIKKVKKMILIHLVYYDGLSFFEV